MTSVSRQKKWRWPKSSHQDEERLARFEREAKLLASLNHPAIAAIHGDFTTELGVTRTPHLPHAAPSELGEDFVAAECLADHSVIRM